MVFHHGKLVGLLFHHGCESHLPSLNSLLLLFFTPIPAVTPNCPDPSPVVASDDLLASVVLIARLFHCAVVKAIVALFAVAPFTKDPHILSGCCVTASVEVIDSICNPRDSLAHSAQR